jgi:hypothetical protein
VFCLCFVECLLAGTSAAQEGFENSVRVCVATVAVPVHDAIVAQVVASLVSPAYFKFISSTFIEQNRRQIPTGVVAFNIQECPV